MIQVNDIVEIDIQWMAYPSIGMVTELSPTRVKLQEGAIITLPNDLDLTKLRPELADKFRNEFK